MNDDRVWSFEESLWTGDAQHYHELIDDECLMVLPEPPYVLTGQQAIEAVDRHAALVEGRAVCAPDRTAARGLDRGGLSREGARRRRQALRRALHIDLPAA